MRYCLLFYGFLFSAVVSGQDLTDPSEIVQDHLNKPDDEEVLWQETMYDYYRNPIDLNKATREDFQQMLILSSVQIENLLNYRLKYGPFVNPLELQVIPGFDPSLVRKLLPYVNVSEIQSPRTFVNQYVKRNKSYFLLRFDRVLEQKKGYRYFTGPAYSGSPDRFIFRFRSSVPGEYSYGFLFEKDAGEAFRWDKSLKTYGFDYYSAHVAVFNKGKLKAAVAGDYNLQFGQGLVAGSSFSFGKGPMVIQAGNRVQRGIIPYNSLNESGFFRGLASTITVARMAEVSTFFSYRKKDAYVNDSTGSFTGFSGSGLHRTYSEILKKKAVGEMAAGANVSFFNRSRKAMAGFTSVSTFLDYSIQAFEDPYRRFNFSGDKNIVNGINWSLYHSHINFFGEAAMSGNGGKAFLTGVLKSLCKEVDILMLYRTYQKDFHSFYGNAFAENSTPANESGIYSAISLRPHTKFEINAFFDYFRFPWLRYNVDAPGVGREYLVRATYSFSKKTICYFQYREEVKDKNIAGNESHFDLPVTLKKSYLILNLTDAGESLSWQSRMILTGLNNQYSGVTILADLSLIRRTFTVTGRYAIFDVSEYETRHYIHERDLLYTFSIPAYYGKGIRSYVVFRAKLAREADISFKVSRTRWFDRDTNGSGYEQINSSHKTEFRMQVISRF